MKVVQINAVYGFSSTGRTTREMHEYLLSNGIDSYVVSPNLSGLKERGLKIGGTLDYKIHGLLSRVLGRQGYFSTLPTRRLIKQLEAISPDVVILRNFHSNYINFPLIARYLAKKNIVTIVVLHDCWFFTGHCCHYIDVGCDKWQHECNHCPSIRRWNKSLFFDHSQSIFRDKKRLFEAIPRLAVVGVSGWVTNEARKAPIFSKAKRFLPIYNWIDLKTFIPKKREELKVKQGFSKESFIVLGVASAWSKEKGLGLFQNLADLLPDTMRVVLVGNINPEDATGSKIEYLPATNSIQELAEMYAMADVFVNPTAFETFGKTTAEALACGTPVVAFNGTATTELVGKDGKCGYLVDSMNPDDYAEKIKAIYEKGVNAFSDNCRVHAEANFDMQKNLQLYVQLMNQLMEI